MINLEHGKYSIQNNNGILEVYRNKERWVSKEKSLIGDKLILALVNRIELLEEQLSSIINEEN